MKGARAEKNSSLLATPAGRKLLFAVLYLSEGAPIGYVWYVVPAELASRGMTGGETSALASVLVLPWTLKFLYAPLVDSLRGPKWTLRAWILAAQLSMAVALTPLFFLDLIEDFAWVRLFLILHAVFAATQDAAIDALAITETPERERGAINGWMHAGMWTGRALFAGGVLLAIGQVKEAFGPTTAHHLGLAFLLVVVLGAASILLWGAAPAGSRPEGRLTEKLRRLGRVAIDTVRARVTLLVLVFAATAGAGFEAVGVVFSPFLMEEGFDEAGAGKLYLAGAVPATIAGGLLGGFLSDRLGRRSGVALSLALLAAFILGLAASAAASQQGGWVSAALLTLVFFGIGLFTASSYALFMHVTRPEIAATQFALFMSMTNVCESWAAFANSRLIAAWGYGGSFATLAGFSLLTLALVPFLRRPEPKGTPNNAS